MSFDAKTELLAALKKNTTLVTLATGGFHNRKASDVNAFPRIVYTELNNADDTYADNEVNSTEVRYQLSIFTKTDSVTKETSVAKEVDKSMKQIGYKRYSSVDLYEDDTQVFHKAMRYEKTFI